MKMEWVLQARGTDQRPRGATDALSKREDMEV